MATATARKVRAPLAYFGGKQHMVPTLLDLTPPHDVYVEVFGGSGALLCSKAPAALEVYNDLDSGCVNFFRVLRDAKRSAELTRLLELTPYSREEWKECRATWRTADSDVEMARRWVVAVTQSFSNTTNERAGWSYCKQPNAHAVSKFRGLAAALPSFVRRLRLVQVEHLDFSDLITKYDAPGVLFYCDPPYLPESRRKPRAYHHEMTADDHTRMLELLRGAQGMVMLSGYRSDLYDAALVGWRRVDMETVNWSSNKAREKRTECVWLSPNATRHQPTLPFEESEAV